MKKKRRKLRLLALLLALTLVFSGIEISTSGTEEAEAATAVCSVCGDGYGAHQVGSSISDWATGSGKSTILNWSESTDTSKTAHIIQTSDGTKYLAWYQRNKTATNKAHYTTTGYHLTASKYALDGTSIVMGNPDTKIMTGSGFNQITMGTVPSNSAEHYTLYYVSYDKVINMCKELGLSLIKTSNGTAYRVYLQPYITCYDTSGVAQLTNGSSYSTVYSMFCKLYSGATQADLAVGFKAETLAKLSELSATEKYTVARDHRDKETSLKGMDVTARLQQLYVTAGEVKPYDGSDSFGTSVLPEDDVILEKNLTASDRAKSTYGVESI